MVLGKSMNKVVFGLEMVLENQLTELLKRSQECSRENKFGQKIQKQEKALLLWQHGWLAGVQNTKVLRKKPGRDHGKPGCDGLWVSALDSVGSGKEGVDRACDTLRRYEEGFVVPCPEERKGQTFPLGSYAGSRIICWIVQTINASLKKPKCVFWT